jgi:D-alanyl-D-alanine-carboxypeptidase/D-alanyl-D-alanine-endopeptidase
MKFVAALGVLVLALAGPAFAAPPDPQTLAEIDKIFSDWSASARVPGMVYGVVADGKLVHVKGLGVLDVTSNRPVAGDSLFRIASMSKAFTALAVLKLRDEGKISLDAPAETYVPEMRGWRYPTADSPKITVRNLLTHTAGFVEDNPWGDRQQVLTEAEFTTILRNGVPFARTPGLAMEYSNFGYATLGRIVSNVSGMRYQDYIRREIMLPLGMRSTTYDIFASPKERRAIGYRLDGETWRREPDMRDGAFGAMGGVETTAEDYAKWVAFLLSAWPARDEPDRGPVRRSSVREIVTGANFVATPMRNPAIGAACRQAITYAMGWNVTDDCDLGRVVSHGGGYPGYGSFVLLLPDKGIGVFGFSSRTYTGPSLPVNLAAMALQKSGALKAPVIPLSTGLASAYAAAKSVWQVGDINAAPLANNMLMDRDAAAWKKTLADLKTAVGACPATEPVTPTSAMAGTFNWACERGSIRGRVQQAPTPAVSLQRLDFAAAPLSR